MVDLCVGSSLIGIYLRMTHFFTKKGPSFKISQVLSLKRLKRFYLVISESISDDPSHLTGKHQLCLTSACQGPRNRAVANQELSLQSERT